MNIETLPGWTIVVAGATTLIGVGLVRAFRLAGATVIAPVRDEAEKAELHSRCEDVIGGDLIIEEVDMEDAGSASDFSEWLGRNFAGFDVAIVAPAAWESISIQLNAARALVPWLNERRGVFAHVGTTDAPPALAGFIDQIGQRTVGVIDLIVDALRPDAEAVGSYLVSLVDQAAPTRKIVRHLSQQER
jgi:NAD(P)-dependent dehydrogenase (short-subunit alcohol dehydrogenase family)